MDQDQMEALRSRVKRLLDNEPGRIKERVAPVKAEGLGLREAYTQWKYENPLKSSVFKGVSTLLFTCALLIGMWVAAGSSLGEATGLKSARVKITNVYYAIMWSTGGENDPNDPIMTPDRFPGTIENIIGDVLVVTYYDGGTQYRRLVKPANVIVTNTEGFKSWAKEFLLKGVTFDFYIPIGQVKNHEVWAAVIWHKRVPVNVQLVEKSLGYPEKNPPTFVVNQIFSQYYWNLARGM